jgi:hypothetical protein
MAYYAEDQYIGYCLERYGEYSEAGASASSRAAADPRSLVTPKNQKWHGLERCVAPSAGTPLYTGMTETISRRRHICARVTDELRSVLEQAAARQTGGDLSALVRNVVLDYAAAWMIERRHEEIRG